MSGLVEHMQAARNALSSVEHNLRRALDPTHLVPADLSYHRARMQAVDAMMHCARVVEEISREKGAARDLPQNEIARLEARVRELVAIRDEKAGAR